MSCSIDTSPKKYAWYGWKYCGEVFNSFVNEAPVPSDSSNHFIEGDVVDYYDKDSTIYNRQHEIHARATRVYTERTTKDTVAHSIRGYATTLNERRGISGVIASVRQYGPGIASNEFSTINPSDSIKASKSMCSVQAICRPEKSDCDSDHIFRCVEAVSMGRKVSASFMGRSVTNEAGPGYVACGVDLSNVKIAAGGCGIKMPQSTTYNEGTIIEYDPGDYFLYDRYNDKFMFVINNMVVATIDINGIH